MPIPRFQYNDEDLLTRIATGETSALTDFYDHHSKLIYGALLKILRDTNDAEDVLQEVFVQVWRKASTYKPELGSPKNWLVRIAHNRAINLIRSRRYRGKQSEIALPDEHDGSQQPKELIQESTWAVTIASETHNLLTDGIVSLPREQAILIEMSFMQGYSHSEISESLKIPLGTVKTRIRTGLLTLKEKLAYIQE